ncbi:MAG TPA: sigma-70 family RNA polymerase sigma factor [Chthoniobacterales bacterium]|nr:sigma-70 family RNA polymerase sigma factor [Chthoniobacterales bacterium]
MNSDAFDAALVQLSARLPAYFRRRVSDSALVEDLTQETLVRAFRARERLREDACFEAWLFRIAHHTAVDYYRRNSPTTLSDDDLPYEHAVDGNDVRAVLVSSARCYLETLPRAYRDPVHLAEYEGLPHVDVARRLGLSLTAAKSRVRRGKIMVRNLMEARCRFEYDARGNIIGYEVRADPRCAAFAK